MWIYDIIQPETRLLMRGMFRQVFFSNAEAIPKKAPVILAVNHPTGFVDPLVLVAYLPRPIFNMVRGDLFKKPFAAYLMYKSNTFPVFRMREGFTDTRRNEEVFDWCTDMLGKNQLLAIYVEGNSANEKRLRPLQKGAARIALAAFAKNRQPDLQIIPVGANYSHAEQARGEAMFEVGEPIFVKDYFENYEQNPAQTIIDLTAEIEVRLRKHVIEIKLPADEKLTENLFELYRNERFDPFSVHFSTNNHRLHDEKLIADSVNNLSEPLKNQLAQQIDSWFSRLEKLHISDLGLAQPKWGSNGWFLLLLLGYLPAIIGRILTWPPAAFTHFITRKKVKKIEFRSSVIMGVGFVSFLFFWFLPILIVSLIFGSAIWIAFALLLPLLSYFSLLYFEQVEFWKQAHAARQLPEKERQNLLNERANILKTAFSSLIFKSKKSA